MARPERNNVDYFPFLCKEGDVMQFIEHKYGNDGYATWVKILRELAVKNYHHLDLSNNRRLMILAGKCKVSEEKLIEIISDLCEMGEFDKDLWSTRVIWCQKFIDSIQDAYKKRNNECITYEGVIKMIAGMPVENSKKIDAPKADKKPVIVEHELFPNVKTPIDSFFDSLINGNEINEISRVTKISVDILKSKIEPFRRAAELEYPSYGKFISHFKNWVLKGINMNPTMTPKITKLT